MNFYEQIFSRGRATGEGMTHFERLFAAKFGGSPAPEVREYTGAVPVTITADGTPLLDYLISGNTTQNGTPTPDAPIMPQGTGERTGNLFDKNKQAENIYVNETVTRYGVEIPVEAGIYTIVGGTNKLFVKGKYGTTYGMAIDTSTQKNITLPQNGYILIYAGSAENYTVSNIMLNTGSTALPYEPYGYKILISSANTSTPVYLGEVESTRQIKKWVLDGTEEGWEKSITRAGCFALRDFGTGVTEKTMYCTHATYVSTASQLTSNNTCYMGRDFNIWLNLFDAQTTQEQFKTYLQQQYAAGTPVTVWYVLATPETAVVNEPLMRIGDYADTVSKAQAGVNIPTNNGSTTVDVDTTVKPSEVYIKYMG